jgi:hypothetical protein
MTSAPSTTTGTTVPARRRSSAMAAEGFDPGISDERLPIGVPPDFSLGEAGPDFAYIAGGGAGPTTHERLGDLRLPRYYEDDEWAPATLSPAEIADWQEAMAKAGLLAGTYRRGVWDDRSRNAYRDLLAFANTIGADDVEALRRWASAEEITQQGDPFQPLTFRPPDPAAVRQAVKTAGKQLLNRDLRDGETEYLAGQFEQLLAQEHAAAEGQRRAEYDVAGTGGAPAAVPEVDASARFRELLESRYRPEVAYSADQQETAEGQDFLGKSLLGLGRMIGGSA